MRPCIYVTMNMSGRHTFTGTKLARALLLMGIALLFAFFQPEGFARGLRGVGHTLAWPFERSFSFVATKLSDAGEFLSSIGSLKQANECLAAENMRLKAENANLSYLRGENESLRSSIGLKIHERYDLEATEVIGVGGEGQGGTVIIDRGSVGGAHVGMPVIVGEGVLVGVIDEVYPLSSKVSLLTNSKSALGGMTVENGTKGIVGGDRGLGMVLGLVLEKDTLHAGDRVVTSGVGGTVPQGLLVGTVENVSETSDRLFQQANIVSPADLNGLRVVFLVTGSK